MPATELIVVMESLPDELLEHVFVRLPTLLLLSNTISRVCRRWYHVVASSTSIQRIFDRRWFEYDQGTLVCRKIRLDNYTCTKILMLPSGSICSFWLREHWSGKGSPFVFFMGKKKRHDLWILQNDLTCVTATKIYKLRGVHPGPYVLETRDINHPNTIVSEIHIRIEVADHQPTRIQATDDHLYIVTATRVYVYSFNDPDAPCECTMDLGGYCKIRDMRVMRDQRVIVCTHAFWSVHAYQAVFIIGNTSVETKFLNAYDALALSSDTFLILSDIGLKLVRNNRCVRTFGVATQDSQFIGQDARGRVFLLHKDKEVFMF